MYLVQPCSESGLECIVIFWERAAWIFTHLTQTKGIGLWHAWKFDKGLVIILLNAVLMFNLFSDCIAVQWMESARKAHTSGSSLCQNDSSCACVCVSGLVLSQVSPPNGRGERRVFFFQKHLSAAVFSCCSYLHWLVTWKQEHKRLGNNFITWCFIATAIQLYKWTVLYGRKGFL